MNVVIISEEKSPDIELMQNAFLKRGFEKAPFIKISKMTLLSRNNNTKIIVGTINFSKYNSVFLKVGQQFTPFVEPFLSQLAEDDIYCQLKPESYYFLSNRAFQYAVLNEQQVPTQRTVIVSSVAMIEQSLKQISFPLIMKAFVGYKKTQSLLIDSKRSLKSAAKSTKAKADLIILQEYLQDDLNYCFVIGKEVLAVIRKWDEKEMEHADRAITTTLSDTDREIALNAAKTLGMDIATVKMIAGKVTNVSPIIDIIRFNKVLGKNLEEKIAHHYNEVLSNW